MPGLLSLPALVFALASGYLLHEIPWWRQYFREYPGFILYFRFLVLGLLWSLSLDALAAQLTAPPELLRHPSANFLLALLIYACAKIAHVMYSQTPQGAQSTLMALEKSQRFFQAHIHRASIDGKELMVTMDGGKVYIGFAIQTENDNNWLTLTPTISGHNNDDTGTFHPTVVYADGDLPTSADTDKFRISLPIDKIASLQNFDTALYYKRFAEESASPE